MPRKKSKPPLHSKLFLAARTLAKDQINDLCAFMKMPGNGLSEGDRRMMKAFLGKMNTFSEGAQEDAFWEKQLEGAGIQKKHVRHRLLKTLERFFTLNALEQNPAYQYTLLAKFYVDQGVRKNAEFYIGKARKEIRGRRNRNLDEGLIDYQLYELEAHQARNKRAPSKYLDLMENSLKHFYYTHQMRILCEQANRQHIIRENHEALAAAARCCQGDTEELKIYHCFFKMVHDNDKTAYRQLSAFIREKEDFFSPKYYREIIEALMNFCIRHINLGEKQYAEDYLSYIELLENKGLLLDSEYLPVHRFPNCLLMAILLGRWEWARGFFKAYAPKLPKSKEFDRQPFLDFYQAIIELYDGDADKGQKLLVKFQDSSLYLKDTYYKIAGDKMLLMFYYQQADFKPILARIGTLEKYIRENDKLDVSRKDPHLAFLKIFRRLARQKQVDWTRRKDELFPLDYAWLEKAGRPSVVQHVE